MSISESQILRGSRGWLEERAARYGHSHAAIAPVSVRPPQFDGHSCSAVLVPGTRTWTFASAEVRARFLAQFSAIATPVGWPPW